MKTGAIISSFVAGVLLIVTSPALAQRGSEATAVEADVPGRNVGDLAELCDAGLQDPQRSDAQAYCNGFIVGVGQFHASITAAGGAQRPIFCIPHPQPTLNGVAAAYVTWARGNPQYAGERAVDGLMRFAAETYPCLSPSTTRRR
ncbi:Rap1a/Tai family immunity protein [Teichococcus oryzae]|uniref:Rap1a immunity protein domain-containing protein n=1 Tax=Teichococcus oryzae TaxID=1608942 RepID=A0A5B2TAU6_9PROT|nr:Rap1a/Tai family immunity protein [Pseudoroseomonas oryzae]KAA2211224.1 hypothetical protein F0Q34_21260 [Pseudoroseomonas oryzae]